MAHENTVLKESAQVVDEIEGQLEQMLRKRIEDVEKDLEGRINREREAARRRKDEIEGEFRREQEAISDYRTMLREAEDERTRLLDEAREHFNRVIALQAEIEGLAKSTVEEIRKVNEIQHRIEDLREKTLEKAGFLKRDLKERFGISTEGFDEAPKPLGLDLDQELEKLRKIKEMLAVESAAAGLGVEPSRPEEDETLSPPETQAGAEGFRIPEIQDLIAASHAPEETPDEATGPGAPPEVSAASMPEAPAAPEEAAEPQGEAEDLEAYVRSEPADGSGEIIYFEKDGRIVLDAESIFAAVDKTLEEAGRLSVKLGATESPKGQFFIKQELINWQEGLRSLFLRVIKMTEKKAWALPSYTSDILNPANLRTLLERLSMENWSNPDEFSSFQTAVAEIKNAFAARIENRPAYRRAIRRDLEEPRG